MHVHMHKRRFDFDRCIDLFMQSDDFVPEVEEKMTYFSIKVFLTNLVIECSKDLISAAAADI